MAAKARWQFATRPLAPNAEGLKQSRTSIAGQLFEVPA